MKGRPPKPKSERKTNVLRILLTELERRVLDKAAKARGMDVSTWARVELLAIADPRRDK